jgi:hypothetical protein
VEFKHLRAVKINNLGEVKIKHLAEVKNLVQDPNRPAMAMGLRQAFVMGRNVSINVNAVLVQAG